jgi:predicted Zn-dependent protease
MGCATNPATGRREFVLMSESQEIEIGRQMDPKIQKEYGGLYPDNDLQEYVNRIEQKLAAVCDRPGEIKARIGSILVEDKVYIVKGISPSSSFEGAIPFFNSTINSFKSLSFEEASMIKPYKIRIYTVQEGDTWKSIAHKHGLQPDGAKTLALINALNPENSPK